MARAAPDFMMGIRTIPRELSRYKEVSLSVMNMQLHQDETFVYDTGSAEGILLLYMV